MDVDQIDSQTGLPEQEKYFIAIGFGSVLFRTTLQRLTDSQEIFKQELKRQIHDIVEPKEENQGGKLAVFKSQRKNETRSTLYSLAEPLGELDLVLDNATYEQYDTDDVFIADFLNKAKKALRQWKQKLSVKNAIFPVFLAEMSQVLALFLKEEIRAKSLSLLGALYLEKIVRKIKSFIAFLSDRAQAHILEDVLEVAQLLACENLEEIENFLREQGYVANDFQAVSTASETKRYLHLDEIAEYLLCREDLQLSKAKINQFLADLN